MLEDIREYTDEDTWAVVNWLLRKEGDIDLKEYIEGPLARNSNLIRDSAQKIRVGFGECYSLVELKEQSDRIWKRRKRELCFNFSIKEELV